MNKSTNESIDINYIVLGWFIIMLDINKEDITNESIEMIKKILYIDINVDYLDKNKNIAELAIDELKELQDYTKSNPLGVINILKELMK